MKKEYRPVQCEFYDYFEIYALYQKPVTIEYQTFEGNHQKWTGVIEDIRIIDKAEYLICENHDPIRADQVVKIGPYQNPALPAF